MANIKSALKRIQVTKTKTDQNKSKKSEIKTYMKKLNAAIDNNQMDEARELLRLVDKKLKQAASKNIIHPNAASRRIGNLAKRINRKENESA